MKYNNIVKGKFISRPNRFIAHVDIDGVTEICHVKNTGRCRELLVSGADVLLEKAPDTAARKTKYDLVAVYKNGILINMDSYAPNLAAGEWLRSGALGADNVRSEAVHGDSRFDFFAEITGKPSYIEVKGVTLEDKGIVRFPDAPTARGTKHLKGLIRCVSEGFGAYVIFVVQMNNMKHFTPNDSTDPAFGAALREAAASGVNIICRQCSVTETEMTIAEPLEIRL